MQDPPGISSFSPSTMERRVPPPSPFFFVGKATLLIRWLSPLLGGVKGPPLGSPPPPDTVNKKRFFPPFPPPGLSVLLAFFGSAFGDFSFSGQRCGVPGFPRISGQPTRPAKSAFFLFFSSQPRTITLRAPPSQPPPSLGQTPRKGRFLLSFFPSFFFFCGKDRQARISYSPFFFFPPFSSNGHGPYIRPPFTRQHRQRVRLLPPRPPQISAPSPKPAQEEGGTILSLFLFFCIHEKRPGGPPL